LSFATRAIECLNENPIFLPHPGPLLTGEGERTFPFSFQEKGLGDEV